MMTDPLADMLTRIRNALLRKKSTVLTPASKLRENVLLVLQDEGYIRGYTRIEVEGQFPMFEMQFLVDVFLRILDMDLALSRRSPSAPRSIIDPIERNVK